MSHRATFGNGRNRGAHLDTFTYDYSGRVEEHSREINGRTYTMTVNEFDQLDRPISTAYDYPGSSQDETILHRYNRHFENSLTLMGTASLVNSLSHNHRGQLTRLNRPGSVLDTRYFYYEAAASHPATGFVDGNYRLQNVQTPGEPGLSHFSYFYDAVGNIGRIYDATHRDNQTFDYDHLNRLTAAAGGHIWGCVPLIPCYDHEYVYEATGNFASISRSGVLYTAMPIAANPMP